MPIIDSQVHVYEANTPARPWHSVPNWPDQVNAPPLTTEATEQFLWYVTSAWVSVKNTNARNTNAPHTLISASFEPCGDGNRGRGVCGARR